MPEQEDGEGGTLLEQNLSGARGSQDPHGLAAAHPITGVHNLQMGQAQSARSWGWCVGI